MTPAASIRGSEDATAPLRFAEDFDRRVLECGGKLSAAEVMTVRHIQAYPEQVALHTADSLSAEVGISRPSLVRALQKLGYRGFLDLRNQCRADRRRLSSPLKRLVPSVDGTEIPSPLDRAVANIQLTARLVSRDLPAAVELLSNAERVFVVGAGKSYGLSVYFHYLLHGVRSGVHLVEPWFPQLVTEATPNDALCVLVFMRYAKSSIRALNFAKAHAVRSVVVTDGGGNSSVQQQDIQLLAATESPTLYKSMTAAVAILETLAEGIATAHTDTTRIRLALADELDKGDTFLWR